MPMASICTIDKRLLPLLANSPSRSFKVTEFIAENCIELKPPNTKSCSSSNQGGWLALVNAKLASMMATITELTCSTRR